jgi:hypothetical protein
MRIACEHGRTGDVLEPESAMERCRIGGQRQLMAPRAFGPSNGCSTSMKGRRGHRAVSDRSGSAYAFRISAAISVRLRSASDRVRPVGAVRYRQRAVIRAAVQPREETLRRPNVEWQTRVACCRSQPKDTGKSCQSHRTVPGQQRPFTRMYLQTLKRPLGASNGLGSSRARNIVGFLGTFRVQESL